MTSVLELDKDQDYGNDPTEIRETDKYVEEYVHSFVNKWDEWEANPEPYGGI